MVKLAQASLASRTCNRQVEADFKRIAIHEHENIVLMGLPQAKVSNLGLICQSTSEADRRTIGETRLGRGPDDADAIQCSDASDFYLGVLERLIKIRDSEA